MGQKDSCIGGDEVKFKSPSKDLTINRFVNCDSHWVCSEGRKINSSSLSGAFSIYNQKKKKLQLEMQENHLGNIYSQNLDGIQTCLTLLT